MKSIKTETQYQLSVSQLHVANIKNYHTGMVGSHWMRYSHGSTKPEQLDIKLQSHRHVQQANCLTFLTQLFIGSLPCSSLYVASAVNHILGFYKTFQSLHKG
jgi:hypothetical protein